MYWEIWPTAFVNIPHVIQLEKINRSITTRIKIVRFPLKMGCSRKNTVQAWLGFSQDQSPGNALGKPSNSSTSMYNTFPLWSSCSSMSGHLTPLQTRASLLLYKTRTNTGGNYYSIYKVYLSLRLSLTITKWSTMIIATTLPNMNWSTQEPYSFSPISSFTISQSSYLIYRRKRNQILHYHQHINESAYTNQNLQMARDQMLIAQN